MSNTQYDNLCGEHFASTEREIIRIDGLNKAFGEVKAVRDLSFVYAEVNFLPFSVLTERANPQPSP